MNVRASNLGGGASGVPVVPPASLLVTRHSVGQIPDWSTGAPTGPWISEKLYALLFGQPGGGLPFLHTYLLVDAAARQLVHGFFDLDSEKRNRPILSLFNGKAAEDLAEAAPYLVDMTLPGAAAEDDRAVPLFHRDFFARHWGHTTGVFLRTPAPMELMRHHFRRFTKIVNLDGKWGYFRFFDPRVAAYYYPAVGRTPEKVWQWFTTHEGALIDAMICEQPGAPEEALVMHSRFGRFNDLDPWMSGQWSEAGKTAGFPVCRDCPTSALVGDRPGTVFRFSEIDHAPLSQMMRRKRIVQMAEWLKRDFPDHLRRTAIADLAKDVDKHVQRLERYGFTRVEFLHPLVAFDVLYGAGYEARDVHGKLIQILQADLPERDKFTAYQARLRAVFGD